MLALPLGPLALPVEPLLVLGAALAARATAARLAPRDAAAAAAAVVQQALLIGLLAARLGHVLDNGGAYAAEPWSVLDIRDGGWQSDTGLAGAALWLMWRLRHLPPMAQPVLFGAGAGVALWLAAGWIVDDGIDAPLPDLELVALGDGRRATLAQLQQGRPMVVNLWASWCAPCRAEMPALAAAQRRGGGVRIVLVNQGEDADTVRAFLRAQRLDVDDVWLDRGSRLGPAIGSRGLPTTLFIDAQGRRVGAHMGLLNGAALQGWLRALQAPR
ncbi:MAG: TlpA disulfide reductase family protein [Rubrivivax sp.]